VTATAPLWGTMRGDVVTVWLRDQETAKRRGVRFTRRDSRRMRIHDHTTLEFTRPDGETIPVLIGLVFDGASIPRWAWWLIGSPFTGAYREAAVIHDTLCFVKDRPHWETHRVFYEAARAMGCSRFRAWLMYRALLIGGSKW